MKFIDTIIGFFKWIGSALEDQAGSVSSKRIGTYVILYKVITMIGDPSVSIQELIVMVSTLIVLWGLTIPEWFSDLSKTGKANGIQKP